MNRRSFAVSVGVGTIVAGLLGLLSVGSPTLALGLAAVPAVVALTITTPGILVAATLPAVFLTYRVGPPSLDMSVADFALICGIVVAIGGATAFGRTLSGLLRIVAAYQVVMISVVAANPTDVAITEWVHRAGLMAGGLLVGAAIVRYRMLPQAVSLFVMTAVVFAVGAVGTWVANGWQPAYPLGVHKNAAGSVLAMAIALVATVPADSGVPARFRRHLYLLLGVGLFATRSRGAIVGLGVVLLIWALTQNGNRRLRGIAVVTAVVGVVFVWNSAVTEMRSDTYGHGAIGTRERQQAQAWEAFETNTLRGVGIRYYDHDPKLAADGRPSSTIYEALAESGIVGTAGLALVVLGPLLVLRRAKSPWAIVGLAVFGVKAVHGVFDNFWVAGPFTLPWLILGVAAALELGHADAAPKTVEERDRNELAPATAS